MDNVNYEEKYPTHISHSGYKNAIENQNNAPPEVVQEQAGLEHNPYSRPQYDSDNKLGIVSEVCQRWGYCGMSKKMMYVVPTIVIAIVIAAVVGGAVGGSLASKKNSNSILSTWYGSSARCLSCCSTVIASATPTGTSSTAVIESATLTGTSSIVAPTEVASTKLGAIAASSFRDPSVYIYVYYQKGFNIMYTIYSGGGGFSTPQNLTVTTPPKRGTPLAAVSIQGTSGANLSLYYLDTSNNLIEASFSNILVSTNLTVNTTTTIASNTTVHPSSSLAALYISGDGLHTYYQNTTGYLSELVNNGSGWSTGSELGVLAANGTPISASMVSVPYINLFYIGANVDELFTFVFNSSWTSFELVTTDTLSAWNNSISSLSSAAQSSPNTLRTYYIGNDDQVYELRVQTNTTWTTLSAVLDQSSKWETSDTMGPGGIASIGWSNQIRFYYFSAGKLRQAVLGGTKWSGSDIGTP